jgi:carboxylesterase type B
MVWVHGGSLRTGESDDYNPAGLVRHGVVAVTINLAKTGVPAAGWPRFSGTSQQVLSLVPPRPQPETDFSAEHHCAFWAPEP